MFSAASMLIIEMRLMPAAVFAAAGQVKLSRPSRRRTVSSTMEVVRPLATTLRISIGVDYAAKGYILKNQVLTGNSHRRAQT
ncbi:hypothetical protein TruAng_004115 [Truncatella angustata]|nr:hypothetical protein TruAng_004115 [Truncatella angustata]